LLCVRNGKSTRDNEQDENSEIKIVDLCSSSNANEKDKNEEKRKILE